jgi:8-oxo-dGTP diphosphatase
MVCYTAEHLGDLTPANEIVELAWFTPADSERVTEAEPQVMDRLVAAGQMVAKR